MSWHSIFLYSPTGEPIRYLRWKSIDVTLVERDVGVMTITLFPEYPDSLFQRDCRIAYQRAPEGVSIETGRLVGNTCWLLARKERTQNEEGQHSIVLTCQHPNVLLERRVVAYNEGTTSTPGADKSDIASDVLYDYINENLVAATVSARNLSTSHFILDPRPSPTFGATIDKAASYDNLLDVVNDITQSAAAQGTYIGYEVYVQQAPGPFRLRIYKGQRGTDRGLTSNQPLIISPSSAHMAPVSVSEDWSSVVTFVYAGGEGKQDERQVQPVEDTTLSGQSPFGRFERFESFNTNDPTVLTTEGQKVLRDYRPRRAFQADVTPVVEQYSGAIYDSNYTHGDIVGAAFYAPIFAGGEVQNWITYQFDVRVNPVHLQVQRFFDEFGNVVGTEEKTEIHLQSVDST